MTFASPLRQLPPALCGALAFFLCAVLGAAVVNDNEGKGEASVSMGALAKQQPHKLVDPSVDEAGELPSSASSSSDATQSGQQPLVGDEQEVHAAGCGCQATNTTSGDPRQMRSTLAVLGIVVGVFGFIVRAVRHARRKRLYKKPER